MEKRVMYESPKVELIKMITLCPLCGSTDLESRETEAEGLYDGGAI